MPATFKNASVEIDGCHIEYMDGGSGRPLLFLHGAGGLRHDLVLDLLAERFRVLAPHQPGFAPSGLGQVQTIQDAADVMAAFARQTAAGPVTVAGNSFGGWLATWLAIRHPEAVDRLVLAAPAGLRPRDSRSLGSLSPRETAILVMGRPPSVEPTPEQAELQRRNRENVQRLTSDMKWDDALYEGLPSIKAPTLILWGTNDQLISPDMARHYEERIPSAAVRQLEGGPHALSSIVPEQYAPLVAEFAAA